MQAAAAYAFTALFRQTLFETSPPCRIAVAALGFHPRRARFFRLSQHFRRTPIRTPRIHECERGLTKIGFISPLAGSNRTCPLSR